MKDEIYLRCDRVKVLGMTKSMPDTRRGEIAIKLSVKVEPGAYGPPVLEQAIEVTDWTEGIGHDAGLVDLTLKRPFITQAEADMIRERRIQELAAMLRETGRFEVTPVQEEAGQ
jgi:hypothetical protein